ncbi:MAG: serine protease [Kiloniellales bacterium]
MSRAPRRAVLVLGLWLAAWHGAAAQEPACAAPEPVCAARAAVFAVSSFDPLASAVRIGPELLVTNRHVVADAARAEVRLPDGRRLTAEVVPTGYAGDLVLLRVTGLGAGPVLEHGETRAGVRLYAVGVDIESGRVRAHAPGRLLRAPAPGKPLARIHHAAHSQPGHSGGALVDVRGRLVGIVASGGEGNNEAIPAAAIAALLAERGPAYAEAARARGAATRVCTEALERAAHVGPRLNEALAKALEHACAKSGNRQALDLAGQALGRAARHARAIALFERALAEDPNAINARIGLVVTLQLARRYGAAAPHLAWLLDIKPDNLQVLRMATLSGKWGAAPELSARALALIEAHHPLMAPSARKFLDSPDPAPSRPSAPQ